MTTLKLAIFDFDGTLVDSRRNIQMAMERAFTAFGMAPPAYDDTRKIVGLSLFEACQQLVPGIDADGVNILAEHYKNAFLDMRKEPGHSEPLYDGAAETLRRLRKDGWLVAGATGKSHRGVATVIEGHALHDVFDVVRCADDGPGKPHPFMVADCLKHLGVDGVDAVMIGDTSFDMIMAREAGCAAQGVSWGFHTVDEIQDGGAHHVADDFAGLRMRLSAFAEGL